MEKDIFVAHVISQGYDLNIGETELSHDTKFRLYELQFRFVSELNVKDTALFHSDLGPTATKEVVEFIDMYDVQKYLPLGKNYKLPESFSVGDINAELAAGRNIPILRVHLSRVAKVCLLDSGFKTLDLILRLTQEDFESLHCLNDKTKKEILNLFNEYGLSFKTKRPETIDYGKLKEDVKAGRLVLLDYLDLPLEILKKIRTAGWVSVRDMSELSRKDLKDEAGLSPFELYNLEIALKCVGTYLSRETIEETKVTALITPSPCPTPVGNEPMTTEIADKAIKVWTVCASKETAAAYIKSRQDDANKLCLDMMTGNAAYYEVKTFKSDDGEVLYRVKGLDEGIEPNQRNLFVSEDRERILAFILVMWW